MAKSPVAEELERRMRLSLEENKGAGAVDMGELFGGKLGTQLLDLDINLIDPSPYQPRIKMSAEALEGLAESIKEVGVGQPVQVRQKSDGRYELIAGERRWRATKIAGLPRVPAVCRAIDDSVAMKMALIENVQREDLRDYEIAMNIDRIREEGIADNNSAISRLTGYDRADVRRFRAFLALPESVRAKLDENPGLFSRTTAELFQSWMNEGDEPFVLEAVTLLEEGHLLQAGLKAWLARRRQADVVKPSVRSEKEEVKIGGIKICKMKRVGNKVTVEFAPHVDIDALQEAIRSAVRQSVAGETEQA